MNNDTLQDLLKCSNISLDDVRDLYTIMERKEILARYSLPDHPSSDGYFHICVKDFTKKSGRRQIKAKMIDILKDKICEYEKGPAGDSRKTFREVFYILQDEKPKYVKNPEKLFSVNNSIRRTKSEYKRYFDGSSFEKLFVDEIDERQIERFCFDVMNRMDLRKKSVLFLRSILKSTFEEAFKLRLIDVNPYLRVDFSKFKDMIVESADISKRAHDDDEIANILNYIHTKQADDPKYMAAFALELQMIMGLREGEVPPLMWEDVKENYILIHREQLMVKKGDLQAKQSCVIVDHTKTWKDRKYPLTDEVAEFLCRLREVQKRYFEGSEFLFPSRADIGKPVHNHSIYNLYRQMCIKLGISLSHDYHKGPHSFRRNAITKAANMSGDMFMVSKIFGNTPAVAETNYYTGLDLDKAKTILNTVNNGKQ